MSACIHNTTPPKKHTKTQNTEDAGDGTGAKAPPVEWTVPLMTTSQPFGCSNLTLTRYAGLVPNQLDDWYGTQVGTFGPFCR